MDYNSLSLKMHEEHKGKVEVVSKVAVKNRDDLSTAYTPGVAEPCRKIRDNKADVYKYTCKGNMSLFVISAISACAGFIQSCPGHRAPCLSTRTTLPIPS